MKETEHITYIEVGDGGGSRITEGLFSYEAASPYPPASPEKKPHDGVGPPPAVNTLDYLKQNDGIKIYLWGVDNNYPGVLDIEAKQCNVLEAGLKVLADIMKGQGKYLYRYVFVDGQRKQEHVDDADMYKWLYNIGYMRYYNKGCHELSRWGQAVPVIRMNAKGQIAQITLYDTPWCRLEKPDTKTAEIENVYISGQWNKGLSWALFASGTLPEDYKPLIRILPLLKDFDPAVQMAAAPEIKEWTMWIGYETSGCTYKRAPWHACYENRSIAISASASKMKMRLFEAAITINYMIGVHESYWASKFSDWNTPGKMTKEQKEEKVREFQKSIEESLVGKDKAFKTLFYSIYQQKKDGVLVKSLQLDVVDNKVRESSNYVPDVQTANGEILSSLTLPQSILGLVQQGGSNSAGSGSPVREDYSSLNGRLQPDRDILDQMFYVMRDYTWPGGEKSDIMIGTMDYIINTLDGNRPAPAGTATRE
ncbi:MAG: hypothetical protein JWO03_2880 [Bacteroidetes bacterium]|nr:hypothetical protein [Bacteroidota bacterium]